MGGPLSVVKVLAQIWASQVHSLLLQFFANFGGCSYIYILLIYYFIIMIIIIINIIIINIIAIIIV